MTIREVCKKCGISADTLRYYERVGAIPEVHRMSSGIRDYTEQDLSWIQNAICFRDAGMPVETLSEYVKLCQQGDETFRARRDLLQKVRIDVLGMKEKYERALKKLDYKIQKYEEAVQTGKLIWDEQECKEANYDLQ